MQLVSLSNFYRMEDEAFLDAAHAAGWEAYEDELPRTANPFQRGDDEHDVWNEGWTDAQDEAHRKENTRG